MSDSQLKGYEKSGGLVDLIKRCNETSGAYRVVVTVLDQNAKIVADAIMVFDSSLCAKIVDGVSTYRKTIDDHTIEFNKNSFSFDPKNKNMKDLHNQDYSRLGIIIKEELKISDEAFAKKCAEMNKKVTIVEQVRKVVFDCLSVAAFTALVLKTMAYLGTITLGPNAFLIAALVSVGINILYIIVKLIIGWIFRTIKDLFIKPRENTSHGSVVTIYK